MTTNYYFGTDAVGNTVNVGDVVVAAKRGGSSEITLAVVTLIRRSGGMSVQYLDVGYYYDEVSRRNYQVVKIDNPTPQQRAKADELLEARRQRHEQA